MCNTCTTSNLANSNTTLHSRTELLHLGQQTHPSNKFLTPIRKMRTAIMDNTTHDDDFSLVPALPSPPLSVSPDRPFDNTDDAPDNAEDPPNNDDSADIMNFALSPLDQLQREYAAAAAEQSRMSYMLLGETGVKDCLPESCGPSPSKPRRTMLTRLWHTSNPGNHDESRPTYLQAQPMVPDTQAGGATNPRGVMASLPPELRAMVNQHLCDGFWQCYQHEDEQLKLVGKSHSSPLPGLLCTSATLREDFLYSASSAYISKPATITIGTEIIALNFPLIAGLGPWDTLDDNKARIPQTRELFIGIQMPSPRKLDHIVEVRMNVKRIVTLLDSIAARSPLPQIRVSFETNQRNAEARFYSNDWYTLIGPLCDLRLQQQAANLKSRKPLIIDRCQRFSSLDTERNTVCNIIEDVVQQTPNDRTVAFRYTQYAMDVKLCLFSYHRDGANKQLMKRLRQGTALLAQWYTQEAICGPNWFAKLKNALAQRDRVARDTELKEVASHIDRDHQSIRDWTNGHQRSRNPFWKDHEAAYWF